MIGYGNDLRADDGAGRAVAAAIEERGLAGVTVRSVAQLTPELAVDVADSRRVVFVDADVDAPELRARPVAARALEAGVMTHHGDPATLLSLAATVGAPPGEAMVVSIPASDLGLGFEFSPRTAAAVAEAIELIAAMAG